MRLHATIVAQGRAVLILAAALLALVGSAPMPGPSSRAAFDKPDVRAEIQAWTDLLGTVGVDVAPDTLREAVYRLGAGARAVRSGILDPFKPAIRLTGTAQGWGLFAYPKTTPHSLRVEVRRGGTTWQPAYDSVDPSLRWSANWLHYRRVRAMYAAGQRAPRTYEAFVDLLARRAMRSDPTITAVRVRQRRWSVSPPPGPVREPGPWRLTRTRTREALLPEIAE